MEIGNVGTADANPSIVYVNIGKDIVSVGQYVFKRNQARTLLELINQAIAWLDFADSSVPLHVGPGYVIPKRLDVPAETWHDRKPLL